jgi:hypothetical protein
MRGKRWPLAGPAPARGAKCGMRGEAATWPARGLEAAAGDEDGRRGMKRWRRRAARQEAAGADRAHGREWVHSVRHFPRNGVNPHLEGIFSSGANPILYSFIQTTAGTSPLRPGSPALQPNIRLVLSSVPPFSSQFTVLLVASTTADYGTKSVIIFSNKQSSTT